MEKEMRKEKGAAIFGTDGVRGVANMDHMSVERVVEIGRAVAYECKRQAGSEKRCKILIAIRVACN